MFPHQNLLCEYKIMFPNFGKKLHWRFCMTLQAKLLLSNQYIVHFDVWMAGIAQPLSKSKGEITRPIAEPFATMMTIIYNDRHGHDEYSSLKSPNFPVAIFTIPPSELCLWLQWTNPKRAPKCLRSHDKVTKLRACQNPQLNPHDWNRNKPSKPTKRNNCWPCCLPKKTFPQKALKKALVSSMLLDLLVYFYKIFSTDLKCIKTPPRNHFAGATVALWPSGALVGWDLRGEA